MATELSFNVLKAKAHEMDFTRAIEDNRRALLDDIDRRIEEALQPFADALDGFLATLFRTILPADWREQWQAFVADQASKEFFVEPQSVRELEDWIEAWAKFCGLLPVAEERIKNPLVIDQRAQRIVQPDVGTRSGHWQAAQTESNDADRPFVVTVVPNVSGPGESGNPPTAPAGVFVNGMEVAGPGPDTTTSYKAKVRQALEILDPNVARWWKANSVQGQVRSRAAAFWQFGYYSQLEGDEQPLIVVDQNFTVGQTAQAIISEVATGWFAHSIGAFYKKYKLSKTGNIEEFKRWQQGATGEAARLASILAELYVNSIASISPAGDLIVTIDDVAENGPRWQHLLLALPLMAYLPRGAKALKLRIAGTSHAGPREVTITADIIKDLGSLKLAERQAIVTEAAAARTVDEAVAIIERGIALRKGKAPPSRGQGHHIFSNKNRLSALRGGPWTPHYEEIFKKAGMTLKDAENIVHIVPHQGPHAKAYHEEILRRVTLATIGLKGSAYKQALLNELDKIANDILTSGTRLHYLLTH